jgi:single-stranded-DNA-specific exonuclease
MSGPADRRMRWQPRGDSADASLADALDLHPLVARLLRGRGITDPDEAKRFLEPRLAHMHDPFKLAGMRQAVSTVLDTLDDGGRILIHGDYDVDGMSATAILLDVLRMLEADVDYHIPDRLDDGYGLNAGTIDAIAQRDVDLLVTVDCGVTAVEPIERAREAGIDVVVVDHHQLSSSPPPATAILNPHRTDCDFPFDGLSAAGVAFHLAVALRARLRERGRFDGREPDLRKLLDLVALGTVADVVPLTDVNRALVRRGLEVLSQRVRPGLAALMEVACPDVADANASTIGYKLAPRLNAAGRIADAAICVDLMTTRDTATARRIARQLDDLNVRRREIQDHVLDEAMHLAERQVSEDGAPMIVVDGEDWHPGVLGIVAGRLSEALHRPALVVGRPSDGSAVRGSARSIDGIDIVELLDEVSPLLERYGGHAAAAGVTVDPSKVGELRDALQSTLKERLDGEPMPTPVLGIDGEVSLGAFDERFVRDLDRMRPFGQANPEPRFVARGLRADEARIVGSNHLKATFEDDDGRMPAIGFGLGDHLESVKRQPVDVVFSPTWNVFRGRGQLEMHLEDVRPSSER